jgi:hypothetical protein
MACENSLPLSVSCHTIPSNVTEVPGSQGPRQSGSVTVPTLVPTHTSCVEPGVRPDLDELNKLLDSESGIP